MQNHGLTNHFTIAVTNRSRLVHNLREIHQIRQARERIWVFFSNKAVARTGANLVRSLVPGTTLDGRGIGVAVIDSSYHIVNGNPHWANAIYGDNSTGMAPAGY